MQRVLALALLWGCGGGGVAWPASAEITLEEVLTSGEEAAPPDDELPVRASAHEHEGLWYAEIVLGNVEDDAELPLVLMLHGRGDRPRVPGGPFGGAPTPVRVIVPRGPLTLGSGFAWVPYSVLEGRDDELAEALQERAEQLVGLIRHVKATRPTIGTPIVTGFSQGGILAWSTALLYPDDIGLAMPLAAWVPPALLPDGTRAYPVTRSLHGTADRIVRIGPTREMVRKLISRGLDIDFVELDGVGHEVSPEMNRRFEAWLEEALKERAPTLEGGLGQSGPEPEPYPDYDIIEVEEPVLGASATETDTGTEAEAEAEAETETETETVTETETETETVTETETEAETGTEAEAEAETEAETETEAEAPTELESAE